MVQLLMAMPAGQVNGFAKRWQVGSDGMMLAPCGYASGIKRVLSERPKATRQQLRQRAQLEARERSPA